ncbi:MAG: tetraacyldisaccharide 4'-kinase [Bacteroidia bacterium]
MKFLKLLYPIALIYGAIIWLRNKLFDWGILKQTKFDIPIISIGNLSLGGTGKTPHIEYFIAKYISTKNIAVISRGYGRKTKGFRYVNATDSAENVGDEPLQIKQKFGETIIAVGENRVKAIQTVLDENPEINLILLDDAFQHRYVKPSLNILLSEYNNPFWKDAIIPAGRLREFAFGFERADAIIITKCPENLNLKIPENIQAKQIYYSRIIYQNPVLLKGQLSKKIILVTGIANPALLMSYLKTENYELIHHFNFADHHNFNGSDISNILSKTHSEKEVLILTTEKDWMRLKPFLEKEDLNVVYIPIGVEIENAPLDWLKP